MGSIASLASSKSAGESFSEIDDSHILGAIFGGIPDCITVVTQTATSSA